ncbi:hypothetical protein CRI93_09485 [Longimonas halophila]|uniref:Glycosyltransferase 2-like domain-containing protein n=1 Tax=Longimonas halophila TaxID=1469170 RepID=A0A2H3NKP3_9BACT|nr:glycosyltransferase [Longimonas halophila]PEN06504.1 hypothetical protein CRI93_09485 [Longimonas halophila]
MPDVSVIIPTYNRLSFLKTAIASCFEGNNGIDIEVVVVDDGSTDGTREWLKALQDTRIRPILQQHKGAQHARNAGLNASGGDAIKFLDDDDRLASGALTIEFETLRRKKVDLCYGHLKFVGDRTEDKVSYQKDTKDLISSIFLGEIYTQPHVFLFSSELLEDIVWNERLKYEQDKDFAIRVSANVKSFAIVDRVVGISNVHSGKRITTEKKLKDSVSDRCKIRIHLIERGVDELNSKDQLNVRRQKAAARGIWHSAYMMAVHDFRGFFNAWRKLKKIDPMFTPKRSDLFSKTVDSFFSPALTEFIKLPVRKLKRNK